MSRDSTTSAAKNGKTPASRKKARGRVAIVPERCKGCGYCVEFCPLGVLGMSPAFNAKGYHYPEVVDPDNCSGCDLCGMYCPDFAICGARLPKLDPM
ncbi:MAG: 4Fe-4S dicluster domain-containing protein [Planctomycetota bacterium]